MPISTFRRCTWCLIGSNRFIDTESCNSILMRDMNNHTKCTSRTVGTPPITLSTTCHKYSPFSVVFSVPNQRAQSPSPRSASGGQRCRLHSPPFRWWSGCPPELPVISEARIHGTPTPPWWQASWWYNQRLQSITRPYARRNAPCGIIQQYPGVYQALESEHEVYICGKTARDGALYLPWYHGASWGCWSWTHMSDVSMHRKPELARRGSMERLSVSEKTPREVLWRTQWSSPVATATTIENQAGKRGWSLLRLWGSPGTDHNTSKLG